jgi:hypothetical protein
VPPLRRNDAPFRSFRPGVLRQSQGPFAGPEKWLPTSPGAYGRIKLDALSAFTLELLSAWHWIAEQPDETLAPDALEWKRKLIRSVAYVRPLREVPSESR